jgi:hypothetical protein
MVGKFRPVRACIDPGVVLGFAHARCVKKH